jgi:hypothetical protein
MSADNGIYIGTFPTASGGKEFRVIHAQAIENVDYGDEELQDATRILYFGDACPYETEEAALVEATRQYDELMADDFFPVCEYGIVSLEPFDRPLRDWSNEKAKKISDAYFESFRSRE